jgi:hypothetical protein
MKLPAVIGLTIVLVGVVTAGTAGTRDAPIFGIDVSVQSTAGVGGDGIDQDDAVVFAGLQN